MKNRIKNLIFFGVFMVLLGSCTPLIYLPDNTQQIQPAWAPSYDNMEMTHYYYFPDWGMYYDVRNREYVYMEDGNWLFSSQIPYRYSSYDFNNAYVIGLDYRVNEPWMHHTLYSSHYPPYYYKSYYSNNHQGNTRINNDRNNENWNIRGFNENGRTPIYLKRGRDSKEIPNQGSSEPNQQGSNVQPKNPVNTNLREREGFSQPNRNDVQPQQPKAVSNMGDVNKNVNPPSKVSQPRRALPVVYEPSTVGKPVKVYRNMMPPRNTSNASSSKSSGNFNKRESNSERKN